jgi:hypothetical protein
MLGKHIFDSQHIEPIMIDEETGIEYSWRNNE